MISGTVQGQSIGENEPEVQLPDLEMLEFLGQFATDEGNWVDLDSLLSEEFEELLDAAIESEPSVDNAVVEPENN